ncbi:phage portal protein, partial [Caballeronia sp. GACF5]|uniref:phage portal protein n=1 Tax=Caballeronia sp. GACF5 TaxID=2921746 RepID=UPI0020283644
FSAAATDRLTSNWASYGTGINADLERALQVLIARSRDWAMNTDMGRRYITLVQDNVVGPNGPTLQVRATLADGQTPDDAANNAIETAWWDW